MPHWPILWLISATNGECRSFTNISGLRAVRVCFHPWYPDEWVGGWAGGGKKFVRVVSQKP